MTRISQIRQKVEKAASKLRTVSESKDREDSARSTARKARARIERAQSIIQIVSEEVQQRAHRHIAAAVTKCLKAVYGDDYAFVLEFKKKRGKTVATPYFKKGEMKLDVKDSSGGGVLDVASFALRIASLILSRPAKRRILVLDEPFKHVSAEYIGNVSEMIGEMAKTLSIQFIIVTHNDQLKIGKVVRL